VACSSSATPTVVGSSPVGSSSTPVAGRPSPTATEASAPTSPAAPTAAVTPAPATSGPAASASSDADACSGTADNRNFFASAAQGVKWPVYCAVLPAGWAVKTGRWLGAAGGQLTITYGGPGGVSLELEEGAYCTDVESVCQPKVTEIGPTLFGDQTGTLYTLEPGYAVYVNAGTSPPSWAAASVTLDEDTFVRLVAALHRVVP